MSDKYSKRSLKSSSVTTIVSLSLVLFMLGLLGMIVINTRKLSENVKENIGFQVILNENVKDAAVEKMQKNMVASGYVKSLEFVTKEQAAKHLQEDLGEDFIEFLGYNPLLSSMNVRLKADYANEDSLVLIEKDLMATKLVKEVVYQKSLINLINENVKKISFVIVGFSAILMLIALALINNTIRLSIYSKRFIIKTMQLVGATEGFIRKPFVFNGIKHGLIGGVIAILMLIGILYFAQRQLPELAEMQDYKMLGILFVMVIVIGIIISWISTSMAVRKYLRLRSGDLHY